MALFFLKRLLVLPLLVLGTSTVVFFVVRLLPGDPVLLFLSPSIPQSIAIQLRHAFGLDQPLLIQYVFWMKELFSGSLGYSFTYQRDVLSVIGDALPSTIALALSTIIVQLLAGTALALAAVRFRNTAVDRFISAAGLVTYTLPTFWIAFILIQLFSVRFSLFPSSHLHSVSADGLSSIPYFMDYAYHLILPVATLSIPGAAGVARFLRSSIITVEKEKFVMAACAMGITESRIFYSYILPNGLSSVLTISGMSLGSLLTGALITESIFALPGMGRLIVTAIFSRDYPLVAGCVITASFLYICINIVTDIIHYLIDPRITRPRD